MKILGFLLLLVVVILQTCQAEYVWTGDEWKWSEPGEQINTDLSGKSSNKDAVEGSGGGIKSDDEDYDEDYSYDPNEDYDNSYNNYNNKPKIHDNNDDEDMVEGSGGDVEDEQSVYNPGSGGQHTGDNNYDYKPNENIEIDPFKPEQIYPNYGQNNNNNAQDSDDIDIADEHNIQQPEDRVPTNKPIENPPTPTTKKTPELITTEGPNKIHKPRSTSFFAQPGILAAVIGGAVVGLLCAILLVMFIVYRMRKKDEGSYALDEPKRSPNVNSYSKPPSREFYA